MNCAGGTVVRRTGRSSAGIGGPNSSARQPNPNATFLILAHLPLRSALPPRASTSHREPLPVSLTCSFCRPTARVPVRLLRSSQSPHPPPSRPPHPASIRTSLSPDHALGIQHVGGTKPSSALRLQSFSGPCRSLRPRHISLLSKSKSQIPPSVAFRPLPYPAPAQSHAFDCPHVLLSASPGALLPDRPGISHRPHHTVRMTKSPQRARACAP
ncbi:hypothetical protein C8Q79DRAFT_537380 [Trametes meyenii]|nr:hypothetical protein C8Q79DRAFT_537380 [Trametes meyenii]